MNNVTGSTYTYTMYDEIVTYDTVTGWAKSNRNWWHALDLLEGQKSTYSRQYLCGAGRGRVLTYDTPPGPICPECRAVLTRRVVEA